MFNRTKIFVMFTHLKMNNLSFLFFFKSTTHNQYINDAKVLN